MSSKKKTRNQKTRRHLRNLLFDNRAISVALTSLIITAGVTAAGISVLYWTYSWGTIADQQYSNSVTNSQNATTELIGFEYRTYSSLPPANLTVYIINCGLIDNVGITRVYIYDSQGQLKGTFPNSPQTSLPLYFMNNSAIPSNQLNKGEEGYFNVTIAQGLAPDFYTYQVVSQRGRNYNDAFSWP